jgi:hypothetical protein
MRRIGWIRRRVSLKSNTCTENLYVDAAGISVKAGAHYPGRSVSLLRSYCGREAAGWTGRSQQKPGKGTSTVPEG